MNAPNTPHSRAADRALAQRERILNAAQQCFIAHGFHAASMSMISEAAAMSPGLIYRYFPSKSAIILSIMERQLEDSRAGIRSLHDAPDFAAAALEAFNHWRTGNQQIMNAALFLEISAEVTRDPALAQAVRESDLALREELRHWLSSAIDKGGKGLPAAVAPLRALELQCFMEGMAIRALREPDLEQDMLKATIAHFLEGLFCS